MLNFDDNKYPDEKWLPIEGYNGRYHISNKGRIHNCFKFMKPHKNNSGYLMIDLRMNGVRSKYLIHRLVAEYHVENPHGLDEVNHVNEDKLHNFCSNLVWCTRQENILHSMATGAYNKIFTQRNTLGKKHLPNTTSKYHNVSYDKSRNKWAALVRHQGKNYGRKRFDTEEEAALHVNKILDEYGFHDRPRNIIK